MNLLGARTADIWAEHDVVRTLAVHVLLVHRGGKNLDVSTATVDVLFVFDLELDNEIFALVAEFVKFGR